MMKRENPEIRRNRKSTEERHKASVINSRNSMSDNNDFILSDVLLFPSLLAPPRAARLRAFASTEIKEKQKDEGGRRSLTWPSHLQPTPSSLIPGLISTHCAQNPFHKVI